MQLNGPWAVMDASHDGPPGPIPEIPGFVILERIGKGGMGEVYLARQLALGRLVAIKILSPNVSTDPENDTARFRREAELMARVSHPNILSVFDFGEADGHPYLIAEYVEGGDLRRRMSSGFSMPLDQVRSIARPVAEALAHLHRQGIVHRDLKPENILLDEQGKPILSDFGISILRATNHTLTGTGRGPGTFGYIAPEQQYGLRVDERVDQYSLAALVYEMLTGQLPLGLFKPPSHLNPRVGPAVDAAIFRALREEPRDRFATIDEFSDALDRALGAPRPPLARPRLRRYGWAALVSIALVAGLVATLVPSTRHRPPSPLPPAVAGPAPVKQEVAHKKEEPAEEPLVHEMKKARAFEIWKRCGSPVGEAGKAAEASIWFEAAAGIDKAIELTAFEIWERSGRPQGQAGEEARPVNRDKAIRRLYKEITGQDPPPP